MLTVRDRSLSDLRHLRPAEPLLDLWIATRTTLPDLFEQTTVADIRAGRQAGGPVPRGPARHLTGMPETLAGRPRSPG